MDFVRIRVAGLICLLFLVPGRPQAKPEHHAWTLRTVLRQLNNQAETFRTLSAEVERTKVTVVVNDRSTESGMFYVLRDGKMRLNLTKPDPRTILRVGDTLYDYNPLIGQVAEYSLSKHRELVDQFLLLGFGTSAKQLEKAYLITLGAEQTMDGRKALLLDLTPKSRQVRDQIARIELWIDESSWLPIRQKFFEAGTPDYFTIRYSNIVRNAALSSLLFKPKWPKGTKKIKPQG